MSLTALFSKAPSRYAEVGPSSEASQAPTYNNPGILLPVVDAPREDVIHSYLQSTEYSFKRKDSWMLSYAEAEVKNEQLLVASIVSTRAKLKQTPAETFEIEQTPQIEVVSAHSAVRKRLKSLSLSIEV